MRSGDTTRERGYSFSMIVSTSRHPTWHSNSYLVADAAGGHAVIIDTGAPIEPLMSKVDELGVRVTHILLTHEHHDHATNLMELEERYDATLVLPDDVVDGTTVMSGALRLRALDTPGHCPSHVAWLVEHDGKVIAAFTGDTLLRGTVASTIDGGSRGVSLLRRSIISSLLALADDTVLYPGHLEPTSVIAERTGNPFIRAWRGDELLGDERVHVAGTSATLLFEATDGDGSTMAWVRFDDDTEAIVGGAMVSRAGVHA